MNDESSQVTICNWGVSEVTINCHTNTSKVSEFFDNSHKPNGDQQNRTHVWGHTELYTDGITMT